MNRRLLVMSLAAGVLSAAGGPRAAAAAEGTVALIPAPVLRGAAGNGKVVTDAIRASLENQGFRVLPESQVKGALRGVDMRKPIPVRDLAALRARLGAGYVVYPRVMSVGSPLNDGQTFQATVLVNVLGKTGSSFLHTRQIGQEFRQGNTKPETAVIPRGQADVLAGKLLDGFYSRAK